MVQFSKITVLLYLLIISASTVVAQDCQRMSKREMAGVLGGYFYDASRTTNFPHDERPLQVQFEVSLFSASIYNLVWFVKDTPPNAVIKVYALTKTGKTPIFSSDTATLIEDNRYAFEVRDGKHKRLLIEYNVPSQSSQGCVLFIMGFRSSESVSKKGRHYVIK